MSGAAARTLRARRVRRTAAVHEYREVNIHASLYVCLLLTGPWHALDEPRERQHRSSAVLPKEGIWSASLTDCPPLFVRTFAEIRPLKSPRCRWLPSRKESRVATLDVFHFPDHLGDTRHGTRSVTRPAKRVSKDRGPVNREVQLCKDEPKSRS